MRRDFYSRMALPGQRDPRRAARHAVVRIRRGGDAHSNQPFAIAASTCLATPPVPPEPLGARAISLDKVAGGKRQSRYRILLGLIAKSQLDRIDVELLREFVDGGFERERTNGL